MLRSFAYVLAIAVMIAVQWNLTARRRPDVTCQLQRLPMAANTVAALTRFRVGALFATMAKERVCFAIIASTPHTTSLEVSKSSLGFRLSHLATPFYAMCFESINDGLH